jgi:hypothetical protein
MKTDQTVVDRTETIQDIRDNIRVILNNINCIEKNFEYMVDDFQLGLAGISIRELLRMSRELSVDVKHSCNRVTSIPPI